MGELDTGHRGGPWAPRLWSRWWSPGSHVAAGRMVGSTGTLWCRRTAGLDGSESDVMWRRHEHSAYVFQTRSVAGGYAEARQRCGRCRYRKGGSGGGGTGACQRPAAWGERLALDSPFAPLATSAGGGGALSRRPAVLRTRIGHRDPADGLQGRGRLRPARGGRGAASAHRTAPPDVSPSVRGEPPGAARDEVQGLHSTSEAAAPAMVDEFGGMEAATYAWGKPPLSAGVGTAAPSPLHDPGHVGREEVVPRASRADGSASGGHLHRDQVRAGTDD